MGCLRYPPHFQTKSTLSQNSLLLCLAVMVNQIEMAGFSFESRLQVQRFSEIPEEGIHSNRACDDCVACRISPWIWKRLKAYFHERYNVPKSLNVNSKHLAISSHAVNYPHFRHLLDAATILQQATKTASHHGMDKLPSMPMTGNPQDLKTST